MKFLLNVAVLAGLAVYAAAFYAASLPDFIDRASGLPWRRFELLGQILLLPDDWLFSAWFGDPPQFAVFDRLPVLLAAGLILVWAAVLGRMIMQICGANRLVRSREKKPFSPGVHAGKKRQFSRSATHPAWTPGLNGSTPAFFYLSRLETFVFSLGAGLAALSTWTLLMGLCGVLDRTWTFAVPAAATLLAAGLIWIHQKNSRRSAAAGADSDQPSDYSPSQREPKGATAGRGFSPDVLRARWLWLAAPFALAIVLAAMLPPLDFDVCEYHLQAPKEFFQQGRITFLPHNVYANMPLGAEMLALLAMVLTGDWWLGALAGKTVIAAFTPLCALGLFAAGRRFFTAGAGAVAALVYISIPWVVGVSTSGLIEGATACYLFLAVYALLLNTNRGAALSGFFAGAAVATKYPAALFVLAPLGVWIVFGCFSKRGLSTERQTNKIAKNSRGLTAPGGETSHLNASRRQFASGYFIGGFLNVVRRSTLYILTAAVVCGPWFAKNWAFTGNPTYPLLYERFDGRTWNEEKNARWNRIHSPHDFSWNALGKDLGGVFLTSEWLSPLVVPLAALALFGAMVKLRPFADSRFVVLMLSAYAAFVIAAWWLCTHRIDRFWIPVLPVLALLAGAGACWNAARWWRGVLRCLLIAGLAAGFLTASSTIWYNAWFVSLDELRNDPRRIGQWHWYFNARLADGGLLAVGDAAVFDLRRPVIYNTCFDDSVFERLVKDKTAEEIRAEFLSRKIAFVFVNWNEIARYRSPGNYGFTDFVQPAVFDRLVAQGVLEPLPIIFQGDSGRVYRVKGTM